MTESELIALIEREETAAYGYLSSDLTSEREKALRWYLGEKTDELEPVEGRTSVVDTVIADAVETILPSLVKTFCAGEEVVEFRPVGPEDVEAAEQETAYINHIVQTKSGWLETFYSWAKDALIQKVGYVRAWYESSEDIREEEYEGLAPEEVAIIMQDPTAEIVGADQDENGLVEIKVKRRKTYGCVKIEPVPPEDVLVSTKHRSITMQDAPFVQIRRQVTISSLREAGYDVTDTISDDVGNGDVEEIEAQTRDLYGEQDSLHTGDETGPNRRVLYRETWVRADKDGDGISELRKVCMVGRTILEDEAADVIPVAAITPILMSHRHIGRSYADLLQEIQAIKSELWRTALDAQLLANNGRFAVSERVNLDDMLVSRPGGVVRVKGEPGGAILPLTNPITGDVSLNMMRYADEVGQSRGGVNDYFTGTDANAINKTATGVTQLMGMAQERVMLIARLFAETGVKELFLVVHALVRKHSMQADIMRLRDKWVPVDPRAWRERKDMTVSVGLGTGNRIEMLQHLQMIIAAQMQLFPLGIARPKNIYNAVAQLSKNAGFRDTTQFWTDPEQQNVPPMPQAPDPEATKAQAAMQMKQIELQADTQKFAAETQVEQQKAAQAAALEMQRMELEKWKAELAANTQVAIAQLKANYDAQIEREKMALDAAKAQQSGEIEAARMQIPAQDAARSADTMANMHQQIVGAIEGLKVTKTEAIRDELGRMVGVVATYADGSKRQINTRL